ncbi:MAG: hypothetical protein J5802_03640 [Butyrivibrio sp.]|nr:hypothetical protein [Butyrivibrio sp.]
MNRYKKYFVVLMSMMLAAFIACGALVVYVDPFFHYHEALTGFPYIVDNQLSQNPGMAKNMLYDSCIIGSSMTVNFDTDDFAELLGANTVKLSYSGAYPRDHYNILSIVFDENTYARKHSPVKNVYLALDIPTLTADPETTKYPLPEYLYDRNPINDVKYLINKDVLFQYIFRPAVQREGSDMSEIYFSWWTPEYYNIQWVMHNYEQPEENPEEMTKDGLIEGTEVNLSRNIIPFIEEHPETDFYIFFPPYSILYWNNVKKENTFEATMEQYRYVADRLMQYDNVRLFDFQTMDEVIDLNNYADYSHYKPAINKFMVECFKDGNYEINSAEEMEAELTKVRKMVGAYDFEGLFSEKW